LLLSLDQFLIIYRNERLYQISKSQVVLFTNERRDEIINNFDKFDLMLSNTEDMSHVGIPQVTILKPYRQGDVFIYLIPHPEEQAR
jgi:hypothetical protein